MNTEIISEAIGPIIRLSLSFFNLRAKYNTVILWLSSLFAPRYAYAQAAVENAIIWDKIISIVGDDKVLREIKLPASIGNLREDYDFYCTATSLAVNKEIDKQLNTIESAYSEIQSSIRYAQRIQKALLPIRSLLSKEFPEHCVFYRPKDIVSGDFYWFKSFGDVSIIAVADCTGHGVPGAFMNAIGNTILNQIVNEELISRPDMVLQYLNLHLTKVFNQSDEDETINDGIEIALCSIDKSKQRLSFSSAKRPLYHYSNGLLTITKGSKHSVDGCSTCAKEFELKQLDYTSGDMIYLFSDGYADQFGGHSYRKMKIGAFRNTLTEIHDEPVALQEDMLRFQFNSWKGKHEQIDDVLVIGIRL